MTFIKSWFEELMSKDNRHARRVEIPGLVAYYWDGDTPVAHVIRDISSNGLYMQTEQRWYPGTLITITLQKLVKAADDVERVVTVQAKVVRADKDGVGVAFLLPEHKKSSKAESFEVDGVADKKTFNRFLESIRGEQGQALVEYLLVLPLLFLLIVNVVNFGGFFYAWITVANASRAGANYAVLGGASVGSINPASAAEIKSMITKEISSLPNRVSLAVNICQNNNGVVSALSGTCSSMPSDPEPANYVLTTVDVTYTYSPFILAGFQFKNLNIYVSIPPTTVHRRAVMRSIQ